MEDDEDEYEIIIDIILINNSGNECIICYENSSLFDCQMDCCKQIICTNCFDEWYMKQNKSNCIFCRKDFLVKNNNYQHYPGNRGDLMRVHQLLIIINTFFHILVIFFLFFSSIPIFYIYNRFVKVLIL